MKRLLLFAALLTLTWSPAGAQTVREEGQGLGAGDTGPNSTPGSIKPLWVGGRDADSVSYVLRFDASGNLKVVEGAPLTSAWRLVGGGPVISDTTALYMADSSAVYYIGDLRNVCLWVMVQGGGTSSRTAISVRAHLGGLSDSVSTFRVPLRASSGTLGQAAWGADSTGFGGTVLPLDTNAGSGEFLLHTTQTTVGTAQWGDASQGRAWVIPIHSLWSEGLWSPYISVRVRNLRCPGNAAVRYTVYVTGTPL